MNALPKAPKAHRRGAGLKPPLTVVGYRHPDVIARIREKLGVTQEDAEILFRDMLIYMYVCVKWEGKKVFAPTKKIDAAWHEFLMFTKLYRDFCLTYLGTFLEHAPFTSSSLPMERRVESARPHAGRIFGKLSSNWDVASDDCSGECSSPGSCSGDCCPVYE